MNRLTTGLWRRAGELFDVIVDLPPSQRQAFLGEQSPADPVLRDAVERLIVAHELSADNPPAQEAVSAAMAFTLSTDEVPPGATIGPFTVERLLGAGGMGQVYLGHRPIDGGVQRVAIKLPKVRSNADAMRRFRQERAMLAGLQHPAIARLVDVGETESLRPYLAIEYVDGEPLDVYCDRRRLAAADRIRLTIRILEALQYAHERLIVHRDIKSDNVFVDANGQPRLLDFGIGKLLDEAQPSTADGQHYFSLACAAPEQIRGEPCSAATDVYAVGALLYQLLTGSAPIEFAELSVPEALHRALHDVPPLASSRVKNAADRETVAANRSSSASALIGFISGDLEAVVARALRKDAQDRYATAQNFADDLRAVLESRPIASRRNERWYRMRRFIKRHRVSASLSAAIALTLLVSLVALSKQAADLRIARDRAEARQAEAEQTAEYLQQLFRQADPLVARDETLSAKDIVDRGVDDLDKSLMQQPKLRANLQLILAGIQLNLSDTEAAQQLAEEALANGDDEQKRRAHELLAQIAFAKGDYEGAIQHAESTSRATNIGPLLSDLDLQAIAVSISARATINKIDRSDAIRIHEDLVSEITRRFGENHPRTHAAKVSQAFYHGAIGKSDDERRMLAEVAKNLVLSENPKDDDPGLATLALRQASMARDRKDFAEARRFCEWAIRVRTRIFGKNHPRTAAGFTILGLIERDAGRLDDAQRHFEIAASIVIMRSPPDSFDSLSMRFNLADFLIEHRADFARGVPMLEDVVEISSKQAPMGSNTAIFVDRLGQAYADMGRHQEAEKTFLKALEIIEPQGNQLRIMRATIRAEMACNTPSITSETRALVRSVLQLLRTERPEYHSIPRMQRCLDRR